MPFTLVAILALALGLAPLTPLFAQSSDLKFEHIGVDDGLPQNSVRAMLQDHLGFLWFATQDGLVKYDGYRYTTYQHNPEDSTSISRGDIFVLHEDRNGAIWIGTGRDGLNRFERQTETFQHFRHDPDDQNTISGNWIAFLFEDRSGKLWLETLDGPRGKQYLDRMDPETGDVTRFRHESDNPESLSAGRLSWYGIGPFALAFLEDSQGIIWIGKQRGGGLNRFDPQTNTFSHFTNDPENPSSLSNSSVNDVFEDRSGNIWVATDGGLNLMDRASETFTLYPPTPGTESLRATRLIHEDRQGNLWVGTRGGFARFDPSTGVFTPYRHDSTDPENPGHSVLPIPFLEDRSGDIWFTTATSGLPVLNRLDRTTGGLTYFLPDPNDATSISAGRIESIVEDRSGVVWFGTWEGGLNKLARSNSKFPSFQHDPGVENSLSSNVVQALYEDEQGLLWIGTSGGGLDRLNRATGRFTHFRHDPDNPYSISSDVVEAIIEDRDGMIWIGTGDGLSRFDRSSGRFERFRHDPDDPSSLATNSVHTIYEDRSGTLWVGTQGNPRDASQSGFQRFNNETEDFTHYAYEPFSPPDNHVYAIYEDREGSLWIGTNLGGLQEFNRDTEHFSSFESSFMGSPIVAINEDTSGRLWVGSVNNGLGSFDRASRIGTTLTTEDGLDNNAVFGVLEDDTKKLWLSTGRGLSSYDPDSGTLRTYDTSDGLPGNSFTRAAFRGMDGTLYFGSESGFIAFHPDQIKDNPYPPPVVLTGFRLFGQPVSLGYGSPLKVPVSLAESITLRHNENDFSFDFSAAHYSRPEKNRYAYMLDNYDGDWRFVGARREASYMNLSPGSYTFRVKASNNDGLWNEEGVSIRVIIRPPWWRTIWAYFLYGLLLVGGVFAVDRFQRRRIVRMEREDARIRSAEERAEVLGELDRLKTHFFVNISHEFRTPLTLILGPIRDAIDGAFGILEPSLRTHFHLMQRNGARLLRLINQLLDLSKLEAGNMHLRAGRRDIIPFLRRMVGSFSSLTERKNVELRFNTSDETILLYFDEEKLERVFSNLFSNALKFTEPLGTISLSANLVEGGNEVRIIVRDTGGGISASEIPFIFDRFRQAKDSALRGHEGTGIGLALVKELISLHGGTVSVESEKGHGTSFTVRLLTGSDHLNQIDIVDENQALSLSDSVETVPELESSIMDVDTLLDDMTISPAESRSEDSPVVLIVEDNPDVRAYIRSHLATRYRVIEATDGIEGLEKTRQDIPALVISDVMMPRMDGYELCRTIKTDEALSHIPVVLLTARADDESKVEGLEYGADDYIYKPFSSAELLVRAENLIEIRRILKKRFSGEVVLVPGNISIPSSDGQFIEKVKETVETHLADRNFTVEWLADEIGVSTRNLQRKMKDLLNLSPSGYIRTMRLQRAAQLLEQGAGNVSEVAYAVGFQDLKHFSTLFRQIFGVVPSQYKSDRA